MRRRYFSLMFLLAFCTTHWISALAATAVAPEVTVATLHGKPPTDPDGQRQELPPERYEKLSIQAMANASFRLGPRIKNPHISIGGLDPGIVRSLQEQISYFENSGARRTSSTMRNASPHPSAISVNKKGRPKPQLLNQSRLSSAESRSSDACQTPAIRLVNGKSTAVVFTPQIPGNVYTIEGCAFGMVRGQLQLEPHPTLLGQSALPIALQIDRSPHAWSDTEINVHIDPRLSGVADSPVTLVIYPGKGQRLELPGCLFIAARGEPRLLSTIAASWVKLAASTTSSHSIRQLEYVSPPARSEDVPRDLNRASGLVVRSDPGQFGGGEDFYDFSRLNPGWVVESAQVQIYNMACPGDVTRVEKDGDWSTNFDVHGFTVAWASNSCWSYIPPVFRFSMSSSEYAIKVWVVGPVGIEPTRMDF